MIERYECEDVAHIWSNSGKFGFFLQVETALLRALEAAGGFGVPAGAADLVQAKARIDAARIAQLELRTQHDVVAFCESLAEQLPPAVARYVHFGATSSDIIDTALALQLRATLQIVQAELQAVLRQLWQLAAQSEDVLCIGRSHGMYAEPMVLAQKWLSFYAELQRRAADLQRYAKHELTAQLSGAVGNYTVLPPHVEALLAAELGLKVEPVSTQIIPRDRLAKLVGINALYAGGLERLVTEIRLLQRSEVGEVAEGFGAGQRGSSTMPHKRNPVASENLTGISRVLRSHVEIALQNIVLWHERDISHSAAERLYLPDNLGLVVYSLRRLQQLLADLHIDRDAMRARVAAAPGMHSSYYLHQLLQRTTASREELYARIQALSFAALPGAADLGAQLELEFKVQLPRVGYAEMLAHYQTQYQAVKARVQPPAAEQQL